MLNNIAPVMEFHISRQARDKYQFDEAIFAFSGNVIFANFHAARVFAQKMNQKRDLVRYPEQAVRTSLINALGLVDEILHLVVAQYQQQRNPQAMQRALQVLDDTLGKDTVDLTLRRFAQEFPPLDVYRRQIDLETYINGATAGVAHRQVLLEELMMLWVANANPACVPFMELFDDALLEKDSPYLQVVQTLHDFFNTQPTFGPDNQNLIDMLRSPAIAVPHSLPGQLEYIRTRWSTIIGQLLYRLLSSLDLVKEEEKLYFTGLGPPPAEIYEFSGHELEPERFSPDREWMPNLVLLAKNAYVWLDQLSKKYQMSITRLDQIPESELEQLSRWGFTGLWLIGLWERSHASQRIKQMRGNIDAVASAYSLFDYSIAADLGGEDAYRVLRDHAWKHGIRLASDMVPNHMGIDSRWVIEHPDWFISQHYSPFPSYTFNGANLSWDSRVGLFLEDHYYNNTDAAVVFKRVDFWSGQEQFIYHGNDGTSMPWNDTAQLNYLKSEVREAVIQTILEVARRFPIIRFDAAMTLAKRHFQRLWFPEPGSGGDIPSRAEHALTKEQFDAAIPVEFWREVVDRVAQEVPDTLLLAEAFWLMEGYFVRTLGMHRVYNSAFMNMLRDEKNQEYRQVIKNTIEFDPEILKRYVNFMNNPDERTAVDQFGKGDKYFGICILMATLPGLPMFGHGQIEGYTEKYGMEFRKAYWDEKVDPYLVERHEREIFPLLRKRYLFGEARDFLLYDFIAASGNNLPEGYVIEDVYAYSNSTGVEHGLVIYHNKFARASGWVHTSTAYPVKSGETDNASRVLARKTLAEGLGLQNQPGMYTIFRDQVTGLEYIRSNQELHYQGLFVSLEAYQYHVFIDFREVIEDAWHQYGHLATYLNGRGVLSIEDALKEIFLQKVHYPLRELLNTGFLHWLIDNRLDEKVLQVEKAVLDEFEEKAINLLRGVEQLVQRDAQAAKIAGLLRAEATAVLELSGLDTAQLDAGPGVSAIRSRKIERMLKFLQRKELQSGELTIWHTLSTWLVLHRLGMVIDEQQAAEISRSWMDEWLLGKIAVQTGKDLGLDDEVSWRNVNLARLLISHFAWFQINIPAKQRPKRALQSWLNDNEVQRLLEVNRYQGVLWFNQEAFENWLWWMFTITAIRALSSTANTAQAAAELLACFDTIQFLLRAQKKSGYQVERLLAQVD